MKKLQLKVIFLASCALFAACTKSAEPQINTNVLKDTLTNVQKAFEPTQKQAQYKRVEFAPYFNVYRFSAEVPTDMGVKYVPQIESISIEKGGESQIFIRYFRASEFLTLSTVDIFEREGTVVGSHAAVQYEIEKLSTVANFPNQPLWRNQRHKLIDIRFTENSPSTFFVFAYNPEFPAKDFERFINSLIFHNDTKSFVQPILQADKRVTKKPFGLEVSPQSSPVSPERFSGFHTGTDFETFENESSIDVSVNTICGGKLLQKRNATGYGGVVVQSCEIESEAVTVVYGHVKLSSVLQNVGDYIVPGQKIAVLGTGQTAETDNERKHLHLGIHKGSAINLAGYVSSSGLLADWIDFEKL